MWGPSGSAKTTVFGCWKYVIGESNYTNGKSELLYNNNYDDNAFTAALGDVHLCLFDEMRDEPLDGTKVKEKTGCDILVARKNFSNVTNAECNLKRSQTPAG